MLKCQVTDGLVVSKLFRLKAQRAESAQLNLSRSNLIGSGLSTSDNCLEIHERHWVLAWTKLGRSRMPSVNWVLGGRWLEPSERQVDPELARRNPPPASGSEMPRAGHYPLSRDTRSGRRPGG